MQKAAGSKQVANDSWLPEKPQLKEHAGPRRPCGWCGARQPAGKYYDFTGSGGEVVVLCHEHALAYTRLYWFIPIDELLVKKAKAEDVIAKQCDESRATDEVGDTPFFPQQVSEYSGKQVTIERRALALNAKDTRDGLSVRQS